MDLSLLVQIATISFLIEAFISTPQLVWDDGPIWKPILGALLGIGFAYITGLDFFEFANLPVILEGDALAVASAVLWGASFMRGSGFMNSLIEKVKPA